MYFDENNTKKAWFSEEEQKRVEGAEESSRAKSRFLARMSHEIRTPITAVIGISEIELQNPNLPPHMEESFAKIHTSAITLLTIVNDVLDLSRIEAGKMELSPEEYDVASMISDVTGLHSYFSGSKEVEFRLSVDENMPTYLFGDVLRIEQIMNNLLSNAFKYADSGSVELIWRCEKNEKDENFTNLLISVRDTGIGMTPEFLESLRNENMAIGGMGLGMSIVYNLLHLMDARIEIESDVGKGTSIEICIPQKNIENAGKIGKDVAERLQKFRLDSHAANKKFPFTPEPMPYGSVLLVDDVEANLFVAKGLLAFYDLKIESCTSGPDAIEKIKQGRTYDIIFMDYMMPGMNGIEAMQSLREMGYNEPIVALTANALIGNAEKFISAGFDGFITKPINTKQLNDALTKFIRNKQPPEVLANIHNYQTDAALVEKLRRDFVRHRKNTLADITDAKNSGDTKQVLFLTHTLKGSAALIHETALAKAAENFETTLNEDELSVLEKEFSRVLENLVKEPSLDRQDRTASIELLDKLEPMLVHRKAQCVNSLNGLRSVPEAAVFVRQVENFDFAAALSTLAILRNILED